MPSNLFRLALVGMLALALAGPVEAQRLTQAGAQPAALADEVQVAPLAATPSRADGTARIRVSEAYGRLPLHFEANRGQTDPQVKFLARGPGHTVYLTATEAVLVLTRSEPRQAGERLKPDPRPVATGHMLRVTFPGASPKPLIEGRGELPGKTHYFIGNDPAKWRTNVPIYARVHYQEIYPGVDLVWYGSPRQLEYDFVVRPGADPNGIVLAFQGADRLEVDAEGDLVLHTAAGPIRQRKPVIYQEVGDVRKEIPGGYLLTDSQQVRFRVAAYDASQPLVIDPVLVYSTYLGGSDAENGSGIAVDESGNAYVTGLTRSSNFPVTAGAFQTTLRGGADAFVTKFNSTGSGLLYSTYLGGSSGSDDSSFGIAVDGAGNAYVTGITFSSDFPVTTGAFQTVLGGRPDAFVTKLDPTGSGLLYSTYLGGNSTDLGTDIAVDASGNAYVTGHANSSDFPTTPGAFDTIFNSGDAFVTKVNSTGSALVYSTYLGGNSSDDSFGIAVDGLTNAYVTGVTFSSDFPVTAGAFQTTLHGDRDAFVTKLNPIGSGLLYSTYLGGSGSEIGFGITVDTTGQVYVAGLTNSVDFPVTAGAAQPASGGSNDAFVTKLDPSGSLLVYSTYLGGSGGDDGRGIALDSAGNAYVTGSTRSTNFPTTPGALKSACDDSAFDAFVTKLDPTGSGFLYSTCLGGNQNDSGIRITLDVFGNAYVVGHTSSTDFPTTAGAFDTTFNGIEDAFVAKIADVTDIAPEAVVLIIDEESIDNGTPPNFFSRRDVNDDVAEIGVRAQLRFFRDNPGRMITLHTGEVGDEGWFALKDIPESWAAAGGLPGYIGNPAAFPENPPPHGTGPGLGAPDANGDRESLLDNIPDVTPLRATGLKNLEGRDVCAVVYDNNIAIDYNPLRGSLKGANLGTVAFKVLSVTQLTGYSSSSLPQVDILILSAIEVCRRPLVLLTDGEAPPPSSSSDPFDVMP